MDSGDEVNDVADLVGETRRRIWVRLYGQTPGRACVRRCGGGHRSKLARAIHSLRPLEIAVDDAEHRGYDLRALTAGVVAKREHGVVWGVGRLWSRGRGGGIIWVVELAGRETELVGLGRRCTTVEPRPSGEPWSSS